MVNARNRVALGAGDVGQAQEVVGDCVHGGIGSFVFVPQRFPERRVAHDEVLHHLEHAKRLVLCG